MANRHMKRCSTSHQGLENQDHSEVLPHTCQVAIIRKTNSKKCWRGCREKESHAVLVAMYIGAAMMETMRVSSKTEN